MNTKKQTGFVLISALIFLVLMIYLGLAMFRGFGLDEMMAGNLREKSRATEAAQAAIDYAEWWLVQTGNATDGGACANGPQTSLQICTGTPGLASFSTLTNFTNTTVMSVSESGGAGKYYAIPKYSIYYLGLDPTDPQKQTNLYTITAQAQGGNKNAEATLQIVYKVGPKITDLSGG